MKHTRAHTDTHPHTYMRTYTPIHTYICIYAYITPPVSETDNFLQHSLYTGFCMLQVSTVKPTPAILPHDNAHANPPWSVSLSPSSFYWVCLHPQRPHRLLSKLHTVQANEPLQKQPQCTNNEHRTLSYCTRSSSHTEQAAHRVGK